MDIIRNFIKISGIASEDELHTEIKGGVIKYSEADTIYITDQNPEIKSIFQAIYKLDIAEGRKINTPPGPIIIIDGWKKIKIIYEQTGPNGNACYVNIKIPYNTFIEIPLQYELDGRVNVYILDAFLELIDTRKIYSHIVYMVCYGLVPKKDNSIMDGCNEKSNRLIDVDSEYL